MPLLWGDSASHHTTVQPKNKISPDIIDIKYTRHPASGVYGHLLPPWLLQRPPNWSPSLCSETSADGPERSGVKFASKFKSLMLAYKVLNGTAPIHLNALAKAYVTTRSLRSSQDCRLAVPTPRLRQSKLFSWPTECYKNRTDPVYLQEILEDPALQRASPTWALTLYFPLCLHSISTLSARHLWQSLTSGFLSTLFYVSCNAISSFVSG